MTNRVLVSFIVIDAVFLLLGCLILATAIVFMPNGLTMNIQQDAALDMLLQNAPLNGKSPNPQGPIPILEPKH